VSVGPVGSGSPPDGEVVEHRVVAAHSGEPGSPFLRCPMCCWRPSERCAPGPSWWWSTRRRRCRRGALLVVAAVGQGKSASCASATS